MCGIAGYYLKDGIADANLVRAMCDVIRHRGPDDAGYLTNGSAALGMRRLSIIDLSTGHQPMSNEDGSVWVVFNGEIYNFAELRDWLRQRGHQFKTASDTETLVHLYEEEGADGAKRLRGMFAYAIWDAREQSLLVVRDRLGKKPLYYAALPEGFYFGSELKCLRVAGIPLEIDEQALRLYFQFSWIPDPWTIFKCARKLPPGCWLQVDSNGKHRIGRYWQMPETRAMPQHHLSEREMQTEIRTKLDESVRIRMVADVPLGAFLSGGIDSSAVVASMALQSEAPVKTFSIGFEEAQYNELHYARLVAERCKTDHHEIVVRPNAMELVEKLVRDFDEPFADSSAIPTYIVSEFAARHVKVALSGDGGDELFGGYEILQELPRLESYSRIPRMARTALGLFSNLLPYSAKGKNLLHMMSRNSALERYFESNYAPYQMRRRLVNPTWMLDEDYAYLESMRDYLPLSGADLLSNVLYFEATCKLAGDMLVKVDRMSMLASLEVRCPLLDHELAELAARVPNHWKVQNGRGKAILIDSIADRLPPQLLNRSKMGFAVPLGPWMRGPLREMMSDYLTSAAFAGRGIVNAAFVRDMLEEHQSGRRDNRTWLWALLVLEMWFRNLTDAAPAVAATI
jgi:asparagine synthase (glutamine-hydrolysing)